MTDHLLTASVFFLCPLLSMRKGNSDSFTPGEIVSETLECPGPFDPFPALKDFWIKDP